ncbi:MAG: PDZ domain-containing protein, partial [Candidatus Puniceispirillum sp.]
GVAVVEVVPGSPAADKGLAPGDIVRRYGQRRVEDALGLAKDIKAAENGGKSGVLILVERDGRERFVQIGFAEKAE